MVRNIVLACLIVSLFGCSGPSVVAVDPEMPDLSQYGKIVVSPVRSDKFLAENADFVENADLLAGVHHVAMVSHAEIYGYYSSIESEAGGKELRVDVWLTAFEPEAGVEVPEVAPFDAATEVAAEEEKDAGKSGVGIVVHTVELVDTSTGEVVYFFDALGEGQHVSPEERYSQAAVSAAKDIIWRIERMSGRQFQPHRLPSYQQPPSD